jgi:transposase
MVARYPVETREKAVELYSSGSTMSKIAVELGVSVQTVSRWVNPAAEKAQKCYLEKNRERILEYKKAYSKKHRSRWPSSGGWRLSEEARKRRNQRVNEKRRHDEGYKRKRNQKYNERYANDPAFQLCIKLRSRTRKTLRGKVAKDASFEKLLGCSTEELLQKWNQQHGERWPADRDLHIDHIRPCSSFDLSDTRQQYVCFNWRNLQLIPAKENLIKGDSWSREMEKDWVLRMQSLEYVGELFLRYENA